MPSRDKEVLYEGPQYFEGTLQLRNPTQELINFVDNTIEKSGYVTVSKIVQMKTGLDYYISSQKFLQSLGKKIQKAFPGELKVSAKLFTRNRQTSKEVHRVSVMFKLHPHVKGDTVLYKGDEMEVIGLGPKLKLQDIKTRKKHTIDYDSAYLR